MRTSSTLQTIDGQRTLIARLTTSTNLLLKRLATGISLTAEWQVVEFSAGNVQVGYVEIPGGASSVTDTILSSVDTSKLFLFFSSNGENSQNDVEFDLYTRGTITNSTTVTFRRKGTAGENQVATRTQVPFPLGFPLPRKSNLRDRIRKAILLPLTGS